MRFPRCVFIVILAACGLLSSRGAALPMETKVTAPTRLELMRGDKVLGSIGLVAGETLTLIDVVGDYALVRYRNVNGRVAIAKTDLPSGETALAPTVVASALPATAPTPAAAAPVKSSAPARVAHAPANALERALEGRLVTIEQGAPRAFDLARLAGVKFYALYFSASWCAPCREFTPGLVDAYAKIRELYPEFEVVLVNRDRSPAEMTAYMRDDQMTWPALRWDTIEGAREITRYGGDGIPCLVLVDENGKVLSDSYRWGRYVGPNTVLDDTWKILRDYRRKNPRVKT